MGEFKSKLVIRATDKVSGPLKSIKKNFKSLDSAVSKTSNRFALLKQKAESSNKGLRKLGRGMMSVGKAATIGITAPVVAGVAAGVKAFSDFDNEIRGVKTLMDESSFKGSTLDEGFAKMKKDVRALSRESTSSMSQINKALFDTVSAGVPAGKAVQFVGAASKLATAGLTDVSEATNGMTTAMNVWGDEAGNATQIAEKFFVAQKFGKTTISELTKDLGKVAPLAKAAGISFDQTLASVSAATTQGIKTNEAFTSMKAVLSNVIKPTDDAKKAAKALGIEFNSGALQKKGFTKFTQDIITNSKRIGIKPSQAFEKLFGSVEALNFAMAVGSKAGFAKYKETLDVVSDKTKRADTFSAAYEEQVKSLQNQSIIFKNNLLDLARSIGAKLAPALTKTMEVLGGVFNWFRQHPTIATFVGVIVGLTAAFVPLLIPFGWLLANWPMISAGFASMKLGLFGMASGAWAFLAPILLVIAKVALIGAAIAGVVTLMAMVIDTIALFAGFDLGLFDSLANFGKSALSFIGLGDDEPEKKAGALGGNKNIQTGGAGVTKTNKMQIDFSNLPAGTKIKTDRNISNDININTGLQAGLVTQ
jgi:TP901 family phage tail tape measure protein